MGKTKGSKQKRMVWNCMCAYEEDFLTLWCADVCSVDVAHHPWSCMVLLTGRGREGHGFCCLHSVDVLFTSVVAGSTTRFSPSTVVDVSGGGGGGVAIVNNSGNRSSTKNNNWMLKRLQSSFSPTTKSRNEIGLRPTNKTWEFCEELQHKQNTNSDLRHDENCRSQGYIFVTDS